MAFLKKIKIYFQRLPRILGEHAFLAFLGLFAVTLILGGLIFYKYNVLAGRAEVKKTEEKPLYFDENTYQNILKIWATREDKLEKADSEKYQDPFRLY
ncbi:MAG: hypothetical protein Q7K28_00085 [Candidatus Wildermuthbacteria bacterium]|nr:hypothetical protein [Candidatus Wildermuthbacteria bacterium]